MVKFGAREGERRIKAYPLMRDRGPNGEITRDKFRDLICYYIDHPEVKIRKSEVVSD